jgi:hypothetical protein
MNEVVNLNRARKARARAVARVRAAENRVVFGRSKAEKEADLVIRANSDRELDGHKREP